MLDLEKLFKIHPFVFYIGGEYFVFGSGVCMECNNKSEYHVTLPLKYQKYIEAINDDTITKSQAWKIFSRLNSVADNVRDKAEHVNLKEQFEKLNFDDEELEEIQQQLEQFVCFFRKYDLANYCKSDNNILIEGFYERFK